MDFQKDWIISDATFAENKIKLEAMIRKKGEWFVCKYQIRGAIFKLIDHVTSSVPYKNSKLSYAPLDFTEGLLDWWSSSCGQQSVLKVA